MDKKTIKDICVINPSKKLPILPETEISFLPMEAVSTDGLINLSGKIQFNKTQGYSVFQNGDVLFAKITPCMENGKGAVVHSLLNNYGAGSTEFIVLRPLPETIISKYLYYFMQQKTFRLNCQQNMTGSAGQKRVPIKYLERYTIPVPPLPEQERIVAKIEELFSQLDGAVAELKSVKEKLKLYRNSVIDSYIKFPKTLQLRECIVEMGQGWSPKCENTSVLSNDEWAVIKTTAIQPGNFCFEENKKLPANLSPRLQHEIKVDDILITRAGPKSRCGVCCLVKKTKKKLLNCDKVYCLKLNNAVILPQYLELVLNSPEFLKKIDLCKTGGNDSGLNLTQSRFLAIEIPISTLDNQQKAINQIEARLSACSNIEQTVDTALQQAAALRQSILKQAFEGNL